MPPAVCFPVPVVPSRELLAACRQLLSKRVLRPPNSRGSYVDVADMDAAGLARLYLHCQHHSVDRNRGFEPATRREAVTVIHWVNQALSDPLRQSSPVVESIRN